MKLHNGGQATNTRTVVEAGHFRMGSFAGFFFFAPFLLLLLLSEQHSVRKIIMRPAAGLVRRNKKKNTPGGAPEMGTLIGFLLLITGTRCVCVW